MAIISDYMIYGNCKSCGKYLPKGSLCCDKSVKSNYDAWLEDTMNRDSEPKEVSKHITSNSTKRYILYRDDKFYGAGPLDHIQSLICDYLEDHMDKHNKVFFSIVEKEWS